ncbi:4-hydroxythreonine-4-phosphate dehydrogenase PdxA [Treponema denticola]|uniref:4-hydroxythreonine-4-phosphate dehydrogenase PdxA n=1 Tax=Treponema denticola TaxID=158 RepID=A0A9Q9BJU9_TREDN|nr:4-hydroxythreonine-4-phosphate dehydrogenase PdxA [Treponema denticola]UTC90336.1 4-hydroxythreonine-4-phosphate dehydrogenase PdxA [Treponema denticola]UTD00312.1 4-hydroxythreonine-4-phosphate dehydrogenase PdxA [Treponema denticola]UTD05142.1 4-hydroxythreonine-4-phosphate dehydrogenase PdxA [Treponema denticola]
MNYLGITIGDPAGIGPEISLKVLDKYEEYKDSVILYGSISILEYYKNILNLTSDFSLITNPHEFQKGKINIINVVDLDINSISIGNVSEICGRCAYLYVEKAIKDALNGRIKAVVTAPLNKEALNKGGYAYEGHTEIFAKLTNTKKYAMMLWSEKLSVIHVSTHCSLKNACERATKERVFDTIELAQQGLQKMGVKTPRIAVAGLNPHSGESGLFGREEIEQIIPAIDKAKKKGWNVDGPISPDVVFLKAYNGDYDIVVAMYHDQGHIPLKLLAFGNGVNITLGLPIVRTSVDHGTAFDIAGKGIANEEDLFYALRAGKKFI